jgi:hypothetical protein
LLPRSGRSPAAGADMGRSYQPGQGAHHVEIK